MGQPVTAINRKNSVKKYTLTLDGINGNDYADLELMGNSSGGWEGYFNLVLEGTGNAGNGLDNLLITLESRYYTGEVDENGDYYHDPTVDATALTLESGLDLSTNLAAKMYDLNYFYDNNGTGQQTLNCPAIRMTITNVAGGASDEGTVNAYLGRR